MREKIETVKEIIYEAGNKIRIALQEALDIESKGAKDWVTNIDKSTEKLIVDSILKKYSNASFLTEEDTVDFELSKELWIIDPIDGTSNMIYQKDHFAISVAYYENSIATFGIVYDVIRDEMFLGIRDHGAYLNDIKLENLDPNIDLNNKILLGNIFREDMFAVKPQEILDIIPAFRHLGSGAIDTSRVAIGKASAYVFPKINIWDVAAATIILKELGGTWIYDDHEDVLPLTKGSFKFVAASNKSVLNQIKNWM